MPDEFPWAWSTSSDASDELLSRDEEIRLAKLIEAGVLAKEALTSREADDPVLSSVNISDSDLRALVAAGQAAFDEFVTRNLRLVRSIANRHARHAGPSASSAEDFQQEGVQGLIRAIEKYDFKRGFKFSTYATDQIEAAIRRAKSEQTRTIRLPEAESALVHRVRRFEQNFVQQYGHRPSIEEIAVGLNLPPNKVRAVQLHSRSLRSLNEPVGDDEKSELAELLVDAPQTNPAVQVEERAANQLSSKAWRQAFDSAGLEADEVAVVCARLGLLDGETKTLAQAARLINPDAGPRIRTADLLRVRRLEIRALDKLGASDLARRLADQR